LFLPHYNPLGVNLYPEIVQIPEGKFTTKQIEDYAFQLLFSLIIFEWKAQSRGDIYFNYFD